MTAQFVYFSIGFIALVVAFICLIVFSARTLSGNVPQPLYQAIEGVLIAGILLGVVGMFQPWVQAGYRIGFYILLLSTLGFILWSHITPQGTHLRE
ncbi:MAG: hypothetical protein RML36_02325 [Anaerolineae bacterium]|nr:hypothetical protein [Anaerolineae bacterium]MDW8098304.1 hypothetical protein [Anaerolineae bacterium]